MKKRKLWLLLNWWLENFYFSVLKIVYRCTSLYLKQKHIALRLGQDICCQLLGFTFRLYHLLVVFEHVTWNLSEWVALKYGLFSSKVPTSGLFWDLSEKLCKEQLACCRTHNKCSVNFKCYSFYSVVVFSRFFKEWNGYHMIGANTWQIQIVM